MKLISPSFRNGKAMPSKYTCDGANVSPAVVWADLPGRTRSLTLIVHDPDAPGGDWVHWVIFNMKPGMSGLGEGMPPEPVLDQGIRQGMNDFNQIGYSGPCPPQGRHRYVFRLFALDSELPLLSGATRKQILAAMSGHILEESELCALYERVLVRR